MAWHFLEIWKINKLGAGVDEEIRRVWKIERVQEERHSGLV
jgi:hypothetical protein